MSGLTIKQNKRSRTVFNFIRKALNARAYKEQKLDLQVHLETSKATVPQRFCQQNKNLSEMITPCCGVRKLFALGFQSEK